MTPKLPLAMAACVLVLSGAACTREAAPAQVESRTRPQDALEAAARFRRVPGEILVRYRRTASPFARARAARTAGADVLREFRHPEGLALLKTHAGRDPARTLAALQTTAEVEYAEPNFVQRAFAVPDDPRFAEQWGLHNAASPGTDIHAPAAWDRTVGAADVVVAVLDTGIDTTHPDLAANLWSNPLDCDADGQDDDGNGWADDCHGIDVLAGTGHPVDDAGHGTHVAGIIGAAGNDGVGISGVAWNVGMVACKWLDENGEGTTADAITCLDYVADLKDRGVAVVATNNSWGAWFPSRALADAIDAQRARGILFVTAAGNEGLSNDEVATFPCSYEAPNVLCVAASNQMDWIPGWSSWGQSTVHLAAPGTDILSTVPVSQGSYALDSGTSMAAPHVTGAIALLYAQDPGLDWRAAKNLILSSGDRPTAHSMGLTLTRSRLNVERALSCAGAELAARWRPAGKTLTLAPGARLDLSAVSVVCGAPNGPVSIVVSPGDETVTLLDDGAGKDLVAGDGLYAGAWTPSAPGTYMLWFPGEDVVHVIVEPDLEPGFPVRVWSDWGSFTAGPNVHTLVGDIGGDARPEILLTGLSYGPLWAFRGDGTLALGWPVFDIPGVAYPALGQLRAGGAREVVASYNGDGSEGALAAYGGDGQLLGGWPSANMSVNGTPASAAPMTADADGDGIDEVFYSWIFGADGSTFAEVQFGWNSPAIADLDADGELELVTATGTSNSIVTLSVRRLDGSALPGFPVAFEGSARTYPVIADVDADGAPEIVVVGGAALLVYGRDAALERTIPLSSRPAYGSAPAIADLDGDSIPEVVVQLEGSVDVVRGDGSAFPGWPLAVPGRWMGNSSPVVGDVDGDGAPEIVFVTQQLGSATTGSVHVHHHDGVSHPRFPRTLELGAGMTPAIADVDGDGRNEIVVGGDFWNGRIGYRDSLWVFDLGGPAHGPVLWGQFMGNAQHTGTAVPASVRPRTYFTVEVARTGPGLVASAPEGIQCGTTCSHRWESGTSVILTATPDEGHEVRWAGACTGTGPTCALQVSSDASVGIAFSRIRRQLTIVRTGPGAGSVASMPSGISCGGTCSAAFDQGTIVTLTALADAVSELAGWSGACTGSQAECVVTMAGDQAAEAQFVRRRYSLAVVRTGTGLGAVSVEPTGLACGEGCAGSFEVGTAVTLTATAGAGSVFAGWSDGCVGAEPCVVVLGQDVFVTARFDSSGGGAGGGGGGGCNTGVEGSALALLSVGAVLRLRRRRSA